MVAHFVGRLPNRPWPVADPEPRIILLLRTLRIRNNIPAEELERAYAALDQLLTDWESHENMTALRTALGVSSLKRRRRQLTVKAEYDLCARMMNEAYNGKNLRTFSAAAQQLGEDEKPIERAWAKWGFMMRATLRNGAKSGLMRGAREALKRLPATPTRSYRRAKRKRMR